MNNLIKTELSPDCGGENCKYNGEFLDEEGNAVECRCDECDYLMCCLNQAECAKCDNADCAFSELYKTV